MHTAAVLGCEGDTLETLFSKMFKIGTGLSKYKLITEFHVLTSKYVNVYAST